MIELYINNAVFILVTNSLTKIINPIKSRCLCVRLKNPTIKQIDNFITDVNEKEKLKITRPKIKNILKSCNRNLKKAILDLELYSYQNKKILENKINTNVEKIVNTLKNKNFNIKLVENWEKILYKLIINFSIEDNTILKLLFEKIILLKDDIDFKKQVLSVTTEIDNRMTTGSKSIIHLNNYLSKMFEIMKKYSK